MPITAFCTVTNRPGAQANKPIEDPAKALGLMLRADRKAPDVAPTLADWPHPPEAFLNATWVTLKGFRSEIEDYSFLSGFPKLTELRFERGNASVEGLPDQITSLVIDDAALQQMDRSARMVGFDKLRIAPISNYEAEAIGELTGLSDLSVSGHLDDPIDAGNWRDLTNLETLFAASIPFASTDFLAHLVNLRSLQVSNIGLERINALTHLPLERLSWTELRHMQDATGLAEMTRLRELYIYQNLPHLDVISSMTGLESLKINASAGDLSALAGMTELKLLEISLPTRGDIAPLRNMPKLTHLNLSFADGSPSLYAKTRKAVVAALEN